MAEALKHNYNAAYIIRLASALKKAHPVFPVARFKKQVLDREWKNRELKQRLHHITVCIHDCLQLPYQQAIRVLIQACKEFGGYEGMFFPDFVETYGQQDWKTSLPALEAFTKVSSSEFAVRPFIASQPKTMMAQMKRWARHDNHHVRRLASEGCRPRLPWAMALPAFKRDPSMIFPILDILRADESLYVRKSVANNLNDISKDHPELVIRWCRKHLGSNPHTDWIIKRACRSLLKAAHPDALALFSYTQTRNIRLSKLSLDRKQLRIGQSLQFSWQADQLPRGPLRVEYAIHFVKQNGKTSLKKFHVFDGHNIEPSRRFSKRHSFQQRTTRTHHRGEHVLEVVINGKPMAKKSFMLS